MRTLTPTPAPNQNPLERARERKGASRLSLAHQSGVSRTTLDRRFERPETMTLAQVYDLAPLLDLSPADLAREVFDFIAPPTSKAA